MLGRGRSRSRSRCCSASSGVCCDGTGPCLLLMWLRFCPRPAATAAAPAVATRDSCATLSCCGRESSSTLSYWVCNCTCCCVGGTSALPSSGAAGTAPLLSPAVSVTAPSAVGGTPALPSPGAAVTPPLHSLAAAVTPLYSRLLLLLCPLKTAHSSSLSNRSRRCSRQPAQRKDERKLRGRTGKPGGEGGARPPTRGLPCPPQE
ncbi:unnamed protein product [Closterium sp. NIES-64]|nr:unnamed protein product [Closterium sp. NIES-64]